MALSKTSRLTWTGFIFSDTEIEMPLMVKSIFKLLLRGLEGFLTSVFTLMNVPLKSPTYTCISKGSKSVKVKYSLPNRGTVDHVLLMPQA
ncbi:hypothetical protein BTN49_2763 [Candidatus Enterovibrio escicola]|uniref:Transposase DDE domain-containing protein n=1 Tax=Candidatus Enterovibrio escicola TaxID=1927127 RepID=A0A2A5T0T0_9GAMM|nr:hypothetical protein BTN49_2763 [Candidatus Enterovibrio escacola]